MPKKNYFKEFRKMEEIVLLVALLAMILIMSMLSPYFFTTKNLMNILNQASITLIAGIGTTLLILIGEIDLSIGSVSALAGIMAVKTINVSQNIFLGMIVGIAISCMFALFIIMIVNHFSLASMIVTIGMMTSVRGLCMLVTNAVAVQNQVPAFTKVGTGYVGVVPIPVIIAAVIFVCVNFIIRRTVLGREIYATGGNAKSAIAAGINTKKIKIICFVISGALVGISAMILTSRVNSGQPNLAEGFEFTVIAAAILGGASLSGGKGTLFGTLLGVLIMQVLENGMVLMNISSFYQDVVSGAVIILAVILDAQRKMNAGRTLKKKVLARSAK